MYSPYIPALFACSINHNHLPYLVARIRSKHPRKVYPHHTLRSVCANQSLPTPPQPAPVKGRVYQWQSSEFASVLDVFLSSDDAPVCKASNLATEFHATLVHYVTRDFLLGHSKRSFCDVSTAFAAAPIYRLSKVRKPKTKSS